MSNFIILKTSSRRWVIAEKSPAAVSFDVKGSGTFSYSPYSVITKPIPLLSTAESILWELINLESKDYSVTTQEYLLKE